MKLTVNDELREFPEGISLHGLLTELGLAGRKGLAVAVNQAVVPASQWAAAQLCEGDAVLVIQATQGG